MSRCCEYHKDTIMTWTFPRPMTIEEMVNRHLNLKYNEDLNCVSSYIKYDAHGYHFPLTHEYYKMEIYRTNEVIIKLFLDFLDSKELVLEDEYVVKKKGG